MATSIKEIEANLFVDKNILKILMDSNITKTIMVPYLDHNEGLAKSGGYRRLADKTELMDIKTIDREINISKVIKKLVNEIDRLKTE